MADPIINPEPQFCDQNGVPYAGGTITTYIMGTSTPKTTWMDPGLTAMNTNPIVLDAAGRCVMWGDGDYRLILQDAAGNLIWDQPSTSIVSAAMAAVVSAPTTQDAMDAMGVTAAINAEANARSAADSNEAVARANYDAAEAQARNQEDIYLQNTISAETSARESYDNYLYGLITAIPPLPGGIVTMQTGSGTSDSSGNVSATYPYAYTVHTVAVQLNAAPAQPTAFYTVGPYGQITNNSFSGQLVKVDISSGNTITLPNQSFNWYVSGY